MSESKLPIEIKQTRASRRVRASRLTKGDGARDKWIICSTCNADDDESLTPNELINSRADEQKRDQLSCVRFNTGPMHSNLELKGHRKMIFDRLDVRARKLANRIACLVAISKLRVSQSGFGCASSGSLCEKQEQP